MRNEYTARKVGLKDLQPCMICCKPTTTVLYNGVDWFYSCDIHLENNPQFVTPLYSKEYQDAVNKLKELKCVAADVDNRRDNWVVRLLKNKSSDEDGEKVSSDDAKDQREEFQRRYEKQLDVVCKLQRNNRKYRLDRIIFDSRIRRRYVEAKWREQKRFEDKNYTNTDPQELETNFSFPSVPKS